MNAHGHHFLDNIKKFDAFQKTIEDAKLRTLTGAISKASQFFFYVQLSPLMSKFLAFQSQ